ncbi:hypothetical protein DXG01_009029 [Tephrocybe rancida]|nr:hypothetical protein DXG01_009029 [Tephrocybe rancida]
MRSLTLLSLFVAHAITLASPAQSAAVPGSVFNRIVHIWLENTDFSAASADPNLKALAQQGLTLTNYFALTHPSQPNYIAAVGGEYFGMNSDNTANLPTNVSSVVDLLEDKGISWAEYQEDMPTTGFTGATFTNPKTGASDYVRKHNPVMTYQSVNTKSARLANVKNFTLFQQDLAANQLPQWMFITPNMTNDAHDTSITVAGTWSKNFLTPLLANPNFNDGKTLVVLTFDETGSSSSANRVFAIVLGGALPANLVGTSDTNFYTHYSFISTVEANWNLHTLGRWDVGANVLNFVGTVTGDATHVANVSTVLLNKSYPGIFNTGTWAKQPIPNTNLVVNGRTVLPAIQTQWASQVAFVTATVALSSLYVVSSLYKTWVNRKALDNIPSIGGSGALSSYKGAYKAIFQARDMVQEGYNKYRGAVFKIPGISNWTVVISGHQLVDELRKAPEDQISFNDAAAESLQMLYTMGPEIRYDFYHVNVVKTSLTRSLVNRFPDVQDEIVAAFKDYMPATDGRDPDYRDLNVQFSIDVIKAAQTINLFPEFLKPLAGRYLTNVEPQIQRAIGHLRLLIQDRLDKEVEYGKEWPEKPVSMSSLRLAPLRKHAEGKHRTVRDLTLRILNINFAAIHTTSNAFTQIIYDLAANPSFVPELREEVETVISEEGLTKVSLHKMVKLDSFIKESSRIRALGAVTMQRKVNKDFTFSDGTVVPRGNVIAVAHSAMHHDEVWRHRHFVEISTQATVFFDNQATYTDPSVFDGFRFSKMREQQAEGFSCHQMVALTPEYIVFGYGKHAWFVHLLSPGRFFAVNELKALLVHTLLNYDVSFENNGARPADRWFGLRVSPDPNASVMFRKRQT